MNSSENRITNGYDAYRDVAIKKRITCMSHGDRNQCL